MSTKRNREKVKKVKQYMVDEHKKGEEKRKIKPKKNTNILGNQGVRNISPRRYVEYAVMRIKKDRRQAQLHHTGRKKL